MTHPLEWDDDAEAMLRDMHNRQKTTGQMAAKFGCGKTAIGNKLRAMQLVPSRANDYSGPPASKLRENYGLAWFEDVPAEVIDREWPRGKHWNWRQLVRREVSPGCAALMCTQ